MELLRTNSFKIIGRLKSQDLKVGRKDNGEGYISGKAIIISNLDGRDNEFEVSFYTNQLTKDKKESQLFITYSNLESLVGKKVEVTGELRESRFWSRASNQMVSAQQLSGRFIRGTTESSIDEGSFELGGFVIEELKEKKNKDNEVYRYDLALGQSNYSGTSMSRFVVHVDPNEREIVNGVRSYRIGQTVRVNGDLRFIVNIVTSTASNEGGFGSGVTRTFTNKIHSFFVRGGTAPIADAAQGMYSSDVVRSLVAAYKARDVELSAKAKDSGADAVEEAAPVSSRQTSLI